MHHSKDPQQIAAMFSAIARRYDLANHILSFNRDKHWRKKLVAVCTPKSGDKILDVCTGTADLAIEFARSGGDVEVIGLDLSKEMLDVGRSKVQRWRLQEKIKLQEGNALQLPFADESFDIVTIAFGLRNLPNPDKGISEMSRVLKKGGRLAILEFSIPENTLFRKLYLFYLGKIMPVWGGALAGSRSAYEYLHASILGFLDREEILELMRAARLNNLKTLTLSFGIATLYLGDGMIKARGAVRSDPNSPPVPDLRNHLPLKIFEQQQHLTTLACFAPKNPETVCSFNGNDFETR